MTEKNLDFTAEQINHRLSLIDENKNLLAYPYTAAFSTTGLIDVGDGSILTNALNSNTDKLTLNTFPLAAGAYQVSLAVTDLADRLVPQHDFSLVVSGTDVRQSGTTFTVTAQTTVKVELIIPSTFSSNWLIKPQIVKAGEDTSVWVPNMDKIGTYVDRRFNGTNAKFKDILAFMSLVEISEV